MFFEINITKKITTKQVENRLEFKSLEQSFETIKSDWKLYHNLQCLL